MTNDSLYQLIWMSRPLMQAAEACVEKGLADTELTVRMRAVLEIIHLHGDLPVPEIAARLEIKRQYVQLMVNETMVSGFTQQCPNPRHKRSPLLTLTDKGRALIEHVMRQEKDVMQIIGADLSPDEVATALTIVRTVTERLKDQAGQP